MEGRVLVAMELADDGGEVHRELDDLGVVDETETLPVDGLVEWLWGRG